MRGDGRSAPVHMNRSAAAGGARTALPMQKRTGDQHHPDAATLRREEWGGTETTILQCCRALPAAGHPTRIFTSMALSDTPPGNPPGGRGAPLRLRLPVSRTSTPTPATTWTARAATCSLCRCCGRCCGSRASRCCTPMPASGWARRAHRRAAARHTLCGDAARRLFRYPAGAAAAAGRALPGRPRVGQGRRRPARLAAGAGGRRRRSSAWARTNGAPPARRCRAAGSNGAQRGRLRAFAAGDGDLFRRHFGIAPERRLVLCVSRIDSPEEPARAGRRPARPAAAAAGAPGTDRPVTVDDYRRQSCSASTSAVWAGVSPSSPDSAADDPLLRSAYHAADVFCLPSLHEPFGIVILEAWAAGLPVVAARIGGIPSFTGHGDDCLHIDPSDRESLAQQLLEVMDNPQLARRLANNGRTTARRNYDWSCHQPAAGNALSGSGRRQAGHAMKLLHVHERAAFHGGVEQILHDTAHGLAAHGLAAGPTARRRRSTVTFWRRSRTAATSKNSCSDSSPTSSWCTSRAGGPGRVPLTRRYPATRMVHDHDLVCLRRHKYFPAQRPHLQQTGRLALLYQYVLP